MSIWDNQQATIGWFCGLVEGEGSFYAKDTGYSAVSIPNNDLEIIQECEKFLRKSFILYKRYEVKAGKKKGYKLYVTMDDCKNLYRAVIAKLQCRSNEFHRIVGASETECELTVDVDWLIGIFEAEGAFFISQNHRGHFTARVELDNTNDRIIAKIVKCLHSLGCSWYVKDYVPDKRKPYMKITIQGVKRCSRFLRAVNAWRSSRIQRKAKVLLDFCEIRLTKTNSTPYDSQEINLANQLRQLNS